VFFFCGAALSGPPPCVFCGVTFLLIRFLLIIVVSDSALRRGAAEACHSLSSLSMFLGMRCRAGAHPGLCAELRDRGAIALAMEHSVRTGSAIGPTCSGDRPGRVKHRRLYTPAGSELQ